MEITNAIVFLQLDNTKEARQLMLNDEEMNRLIMLINQGMFTDNHIKVNPKPIESIEFIIKKKK